MPALDDRGVVAGALATLTALAWLYLFFLAPMPPMDHVGMARPQMHAWGPADVALLLVMWAVMMVAMMIPSAAPMILLFALVHRRRGEQGRPAVPTSIFVLGYVSVWTGYSVLAVVAQSALHHLALLSPAMATTSPYVGGGLLVAAGLFQWSPLKRVCLTVCRSPLSFLMTAWREGKLGAFVMGLRHGAYCVGCCWVLMALLFVAGVMNLAWVAAIAVFILLEKVVPGGDLVGRVAGGALVAAGLFLIARGAPPVM